MRALPRTIEGFAQNLPPGPRWFTSVRRPAAEVTRWTARRGWTKRAPISGQIGDLLTSPRRVWSFAVRRCGWAQFLVLAWVRFGIGMAQLLTGSDQGLALQYHSIPRRCLAIPFSLKALPCITFHTRYGCYPSSLTTCGCILYHWRDPFRVRSDI